MHSARSPINGSISVDQTRKHGQESRRRGDGVPKPQEFKENEAALRDAQATTRTAAITPSFRNSFTQRGELRAASDRHAQRYHRRLTGRRRPPVPQRPDPPSSSGCTTARYRPVRMAPQRVATKPARRMRLYQARRRWPRRPPMPQAQAGQAGDAAGQLAQSCCRRARRHRRSGGRCGGHGRPDPPGSSCRAAKGCTGRHPGAVRAGLAESRPTRSWPERSGGVNPDELSKAGRRRSAAAVAVEIPIRRVHSAHPSLRRRRTPRRPCPRAPATPPDTHTRARQRNGWDAHGYADGRDDAARQVRAATAPARRCQRTRRSSCHPRRTPSR